MTIVRSITKKYFLVHNVSVLFKDLVIFILCVWACLHIDMCITFLPAIPSKARLPETGVMTVGS